MHAFPVHFIFHLMDANVAVSPWLLRSASSLIRPLYKRINCSRCHTEKRHDKKRSYVYFPVFLRNWFLKSWKPWSWKSWNALFQSLKVSMIFPVYAVSRDMIPRILIIDKNKGKHKVSNEFPIIREAIYYLLCN